MTSRTRIPHAGAFIIPFLNNKKKDPLLGS